MDFVTLLDHWQSLVGSLLGFAAAIFAVVMTLRAESRRAEREAASARSAIGAEVRQMTQRIAEGYQQLLVWVESGQDVNLDSMLLVTQLPTPQVFSQMAGKLDALGPLAISAVQFYNAPDIPNLSPPTRAPAREYYVYPP